MKIANIVREILHIFWTTWGISMKFSGKMWIIIILKVTKNQGFTLSLEDTFFGKPQGGSNWPPFLSRFRVNNGGFITDKELKYFSFDHKRVCNLIKLYFLPKIHKRLFNIPGRPVISNCGTPTEKASEFLDSHLKTIVRVKRICSEKEDFWSIWGRSSYGSLNRKLILHKRFSRLYK